MLLCINCHHQPGNCLEFLNLDNPSLRRGTVEDIAPPRPTLPPVVKTSGIEIYGDNQLKRNIDNPLSTTIKPVSSNTFKTSKLDFINQYGGQNKYYKSYLKDIIDNYEEPSRSTEQIAPSMNEMKKYKSQYGVTPGFFPRQREPYPYKNMPLPLPYMTPPDPVRFNGLRREYDREDLMGNKMDDLRHIDAFVDTDVFNDVSDNHRNSYPDNVYQPYINSIKPQSKLNRDSTTAAPKLSALTLTQLSTSLSVTTPAPDNSGEMTRDYTIFDMADAVTVTHEPEMEYIEEDIDERDDYHEDILNIDRLGNHQIEDVDNRPRFVSYSETPGARVRGDHYDKYQDYNTLRPDNIEFDQSPSPASNNEHKLIVDMTLGQTERPKRNVSVDDLLFLYNITFLTDSQEIMPSIGDRQVVDHNINLLSSDSAYDEYQESLFDYSSLPLPDYGSLNSEDKFKNALEEFLEDYEDYSSENIVQQHHNEHRNSEDIEDVDKLLSEIIGETSLSKDLLLDMFSEDYEREDEESEDDAWAGGHHVNHRTHSVPEFANKLISQQQSQQYQGQGCVRCQLTGL